MAKKYHVYGMGNALVDIVTEVTDSFIADHAIEKGVMTLVDENRQTELVSAIDIQNADRQCGGSAANTMIGAGQFGGSCYYSCKVARDEWGDFYLDDLAANKVDTALAKDSLQAGITGKCLVMTTDDAERTMNTFLGITATYSEAEINRTALANSDYLYIEGYLITGDESRQAMKSAKAYAESQNVKTSITLSDPFVASVFKEQMRDVIGTGVDLLFCNEDEAKSFTDTATIEDAKEALKKYAKSYAITQGAKGAFIFDGQEYIEIKPFPTEALDTNGAGDMFAGAFLYGITNGLSWTKSGELASLASSTIVSKFGPRITADQAQDLLRTLS
ncbi:MAG: adenosine kinase [Verrucomicrobiota bacterium]